MPPNRRVIEVSAWLNFWNRCARLFGNADAGVAHLQPDDEGVVVDRDGRDLDRDAAGLGELDRIADQVGQHLAQPVRITAEITLGGRVDQGAQLQPLFGRLGGDDLDHAFDQRLEVEVDGIELDPAGLQLRDVEDVVDDGQQILARRLDRLGEGLLLQVEPARQQQARHAQHAIHRRADLVAHVREEFGLRLVRGLGVGARGLGLGAGNGQLAGGRNQVGRLLLEPAPRLLDFHFALLALADVAHDRDLAAVGHRMGANLDPGAVGLLALEADRLAGADAAFLAI